jgi:sorbitol-specific phosphotransferase system component IIBC
MRYPRSWGERLIAGFVSVLLALVALDVVGALVVRLLGPLLPTIIAVLLLAAVMAAVVRRY